MILNYTPQDHFRENTLNFSDSYNFTVFCKIPWAIDTVQLSDHFTLYLRCICI
jgi:hypothetical protein